MSSATESKPAAVKPEAKNGVVTAYLVLFNLFSSVAWAYTFYLAVSHLLNSKAAGLDKAHGMFAAVEFALKIAQTTALLEVVHPLIGLVRASFFTTFLQVFSRIALLWGVCNIAPNTHNYWGFALMVCSWCCVEVPRYLFYALSLINAVPAPLLWLRYSLFMILYPTGISGEILCILQAMPMIQAANYLDFPLPNVLNFPFNYYQVLYYATALYLPGAPFLFMHMVAERKKRLGGAKPDAKKTN